MELFLVLLLVPLVWLWLLPGRVAKRVKKYRFAGIGALLLALAVGWIGLQVTGKPTSAPADYEAGDGQLRAMLGSPDVVPRYSLRQ